jgi:transposase
MLSLTHCQRIFLARSPVDMRKGFNGLSEMVRSSLGKDPLSGDAFVFISRRHNYVKILTWDVSGFWLASKRLERGTFAVGKMLAEVGASGSCQLSVAEMMNVIEGIQVHHAVYHQHEGVAPSRLTEK